MKKQLTAAHLVDILNAKGIPSKLVEETKKQQYLHIDVESADKRHDAVDIARESGYKKVNMSGKSSKIGIPNPDYKKNVKKPAVKKPAAKKKVEKSPVKNQPPKAAKAPKKKSAKSKIPAKKAAASKAPVKKAPNKNAAKFRHTRGDRKKLPVSYIEGSAVLAILEGVTVKNLEIILAEYLNKKDSSIMKSILKKIGQMVKLDISFSKQSDKIDLSKISTPDLQRELKKRWK